MFLCSSTIKSGLDTAFGKPWTKTIPSKNMTNGWKNNKIWALKSDISLNHFMCDLCVVLFKMLPGLNPVKTVKICVPCRNWEAMNDST